MASAPQKEINGRTYSFGMLPATESVDVQLVIFPVVGDLMAAFSTPDDASEEARTAAVGRATGAIRHLDRKDVRLVMDKMFSVTSVGGQDIKDINAAFNGRPLDLWLVLIESMKVNFADFLAAAQSRASGLTAVP